LLKGIGGGIARAGDEAGAPKSGSMRPGLEGGISGDGPFFGDRSLGGGKLSLAAGGGGAASVSLVGNGNVGVPEGAEGEGKSLPRKPSFAAGFGVSGAGDLLAAGKAGSAGEAGAVLRDPGRAGGSAAPPGAASGVVPTAFFVS
jgi:hypothetical protein